jgi:thiamine pyrophosphate-dependent acetolactate synthase large subunit-like protein
MMGPSSVEGGLLLCQVLEAMGITHVFGLPGTQTVPLFEALRRSRLKVIVPTNELPASFMAGAFYRASGRPAVLLTIPGPGFSYALTGLAEARLDSAALLHITVAAPEGPDARFRLQAIPQRAIAGQLAKAVFRVDRMHDIEPVLRFAFDAATQGEPGPVVVELASAEGGEGRDLSSLDIAQRAASVADLAAVWTELMTARRPLLYLGQGCLASAGRLRDLVERWGAPVLTTPSARGILPEDHPLAMGLDPCRGGTHEANALLEESDLVLVLGAKLGHNGSAGHGLRFLPDRTCQVDADRGIVGASYAMAGTAVATIEEFLDSAPKVGPERCGWDPAALTNARNRLRRPAEPPPEPRVNGGSPASFFAALRAALPPDAVLVTDTGLHQVLARRYFDVFSPGGLLCPSDFQSMGFGLPAAIAAKLAAPDRPVVALVGDGSLAINGLELATAVQLKLPLPVIVFADGHLNQIRLHQLSDFGVESGVTLAPLDFALLADAVGASCREVGKSLSADLAWAMSMDRPCLLVVPVGDSGRVVRSKIVAHSKALTARAMGPGLLRWLRRLRSP